MTPPTISAPMLKFFRRIVRGYFRRHFHAVRISGAERFVDDGSPLIVYANHSSWWDPMVALLLADCLMPTRQHFAPMDAQALARYAILKRIGIFPVEMKTQRGAVQFLRTGEVILQNEGVLWITPQGRFVDARQRPLDFKPGLAALARRVAERSGSCTVLPLAIEYPFWDERLPETLLHFGGAVRISEPDLNAESIQTELMSALAVTMDELKELALERDPAQFATLVGGSAGTGGFYAVGQRLKAFVHRRPYQAEHTASVRSAIVQEGRE